MSGPFADPGLEQDYAALRSGYGALHLERGAVLVSGPDAVDYLQGQCSQDVAALDVGSAVDALLLEPDGKLCALVRVLRTGDDRFVLEVEGGFEEVVVARLSRFRLRSKVEIATVERTEWHCVALRGPEVPTPEGSADGAWVVPYEWNGVVGFDLVGPSAQAAVPGRARWCGAPAWEALRVEAGIPAMGRELDGRTIAPEAGLVERTVSFTKGCYTGQELIARLDARGNRVTRRLCGLMPAEAEMVGPLGALSGAALLAPDGKQVGEVTSAAWCPGLGGPAALGYLHRSMEVPGPVSVALGTEAGGVVIAAQARLLPLVA